MIHGLSKLQEQVLGLALAGHERGQATWEADVYFPEILECVYSFPVEVRFDWFGKQRTARNSPNCSLEGIGRAHYNRAHAAISRACRRLETRGLVKRCRGAAWLGLDVTPDGVNTGQRLRKRQNVQVLIAVKSGQPERVR